MNIKEGTMDELGAKQGDVVELISVDGNEFIGAQCVIDNEGSASSECGLWFDRNVDANFNRKWRIISRADDPRPWGDLTREEKGELAIAYVEGKTIEHLDHEIGWVECNPVFGDEDAYRIKPSPKVETVALYGHEGRFFEASSPVPENTHRITFTTTDGEPDVNSIKMEEI